MTGFIEVVDEAEGTLLVNVDYISWVKPRVNRPRQALIKLDDGNPRLLVVNNTYNAVIQLMLKTDAVAIGR